MSIKTTFTNDKNQQYSRQLFELEKTFTNLLVMFLLKILYFVVTQTLICDLNQYAVGCLQRNKFYRFLLLENMGSES